MYNTSSTEVIEPCARFLQPDSIEEPDLPEYLTKTYWWAYLHPIGVKIFERQWLVNSILWGNFTKLRDAALDELGETVSGRVLQVACVYGDFTPKLAERLDTGARLDVVDVAPIQLKNLCRKVDHHPDIFLDLQDASRLSFDTGSFDQVVLFFLLHEVPQEVRAKAVSEALRVVKPGGKVVFVDYHRPVWKNPHRYIMPLVLKTLEPFAMDLWREEIVSCVPKEIEPREVRKNTYFGGLYQKVVMTR